MEEEVLFRDYVYFPRDRDLSSGRWSKFYLVISTQRLSVHPAPQLKNQFLVDIPVSEIEYLHELGPEEEKSRLSVVSKDKGKQKIKFEWNIIILEVTHHRLFAFGKMPDKSKWKDCITQLSSILSPNPSPGFNIDENHKEHHNEHFFRDKESDQKGDVVKKTDVTLTSLNKKTENLIDFPAKTVVRQLSATGYHAIAVTVDGRAFVWGEQRDPQHPILGLGHDERVSVKVPTEITTPFHSDQVVKSCAGMTTSVVLSSKGSVAVWGRVVGDDGLMEKVVSPKVFAPLKSKFVSSVATFAEVCLAVVRVPGLEDVTEVWSWGSGAFGLLGHDYLPSDAEERSGIFATPREIGTLRDDTIVDLSISSTHAMCCNAVGEVYVWGRNTCTKMIGTVAGVLGPTGKEGEDFIMLPTKVKGFGKSGIKVTQVSAGESFCLALAKTKKVYSWGYSGKHLLLGQPFSAVQHNEGLFALTTPTIIPDLDDVMMINTNGRLSLAKTEEGALYWFGHKEKEPEDDILNSTGTVNDSFTTSICCGLGGYLTVTGSASAIIVYGNEKRLVSSVWHSTTAHLTAFVERVWKKKRDTFVIFDSLGKLCPGKKKPTAFYIERMLMRNADPVFVVLDKQTLLGGYGGRVVMEGEAVRWAEKDALLELLYMYPSSSFSAIPPKTITPQVLTTFSEVFFLTYEDNLKFTAHEILDFLLLTYATLNSLDGKIIEDDEVEHWIPSSLDNEVRKSIQTQLPKTRMTRVLKSIGKWLKIRPTDFLGSSHLMQQLLQFLQEECDHHHPTISSQALHVRRKFFLEILMAESGVVAPPRMEENEKSIFFQFKPEEIAKQMTWIDANLIFPSFSTVDILRHKTPKAIQRHAALACWVEKEILECPEERRMRMVEALIEVMDCLNEMGNFFSYTSLMGACRQKGFRKATGNVWEKGRGLKQTTHAKWEGLKKEDMQERMLKPQVFTAYFEELPEPKIPFVGYYWHRLIYVAERYKSFSPPSSPSEGGEGGGEGEKAGGDFCLVERCTAEGEVVLWLREVFKTAAKKYKDKYNIEPEPKMLHVLMHARGFRADPRAHRRVADNYGLRKDNGKDKEKEKEKEEEEKGGLMFEEEGGEEGGEDVDALLLSGRASFVSISSRLRRDAWGEWYTKISREIDPKRTSSGRLQPIKEDSSWSQTKIRFNTLKRLMNNSPLLEHEPFPVGSFVSLLLSSDALEITLVSLLSCFPEEKIRIVLEDILKLLFGSNYPAEAVTGATLEMNETDTGSGPLFVSSFQNSEHQNMCEKVLWKMIGLTKIFQPLLVISDSDFSHIESMILLFEHLKVLTEEWQSKFEDFGKKERDELWDAYSIASEYLTLIDDSYVKNLCALPSTELTFPEIEALNERMQEIQAEKYQALLGHNRNEIREMIDLLTSHLYLLNDEIDKKALGGHSSSPPTSPSLTSSSPFVPPRPPRLSPSSPSSSVPTLPSTTSVFGGGKEFTKEHTQLLEEMGGRVREYKEVGRRVVIARGEGESDFQQVYVYYKQMLAKVKGRLETFANLSQILDKVTRLLEDMTMSSTQKAYSLYEADPESRKGENHEDYINLITRMTLLGIKTENEDLRLTTDQLEREENERANLRGGLGEGACGLPSGLLDKKFDERRSLLDFAPSLERNSTEEPPTAFPAYKPPSQFRAQQSGEVEKRTSFASFRLKAKDKIKERSEKEKEKKMKRKGSKAFN